MENSNFKFLTQTVKHWYLLLIVGILFIVAGITSFTQSDEAYQWLSIFFSISFIISGVLEILFALQNRKKVQGWGWTFAFGLFTAAVGVLLVFNLDAAEVTMPIYVGFVLMLRAISGIGLSLDLKDFGSTDWVIVLTLSILALIFAMLILARIDFGGLSILVITGFALIVAGFISIYYSFQLRKLHKNWDSISDEAKKEYEESLKKIQSEFNNIQ